MALNPEPFQRSLGIQSHNTLTCISKAMAGECLRSAVLACWALVRGQHLRYAVLR
jgi:hypothetical protein